MILLTLLTVFTVLIGACVGSFLNVCIFRIPQEGMTVSSPSGSFCPRCETPIRWFDNLPVLSWVLLRGKCRQCREPISCRYPIIEVVTAVTFWAIWDQFGPSIPEEILSGPIAATVLFWWVVFSVMIVISMIDIDLKIIPDQLSVTGGALTLLTVPFLLGVPHDRSGATWIAEQLAFGAGAIDLTPWLAQGVLALVLGAIGLVGMRRFNRDWQGNVRSWWGCRWAGAVGMSLGFGVGGWLTSPDWLFRDTGSAWLAALTGSAVGAGTIYGIGRVGTMIFRKDAMGFGDVKLMGLLGVLLGPKFVLLAIFLASFLGSIIGLSLRSVTRSTTIPFGPFLCGGAIILIFGASGVDRGIEWYLGLLQR